MHTWCKTALSLLLRMPGVYNFANCIGFVWFLHQQRQMCIRSCIARDIADKQRAKIAAPLSGKVDILK